MKDSQKEEGLTVFILQIMCFKEANCYNLDVNFEIFDYKVRLHSFFRWKGSRWICSTQKTKLKQNKNSLRKGFISLL